MNQKFSPLTLNNFTFFAELIFPCTDVEKSVKIATAAKQSVQQEVINPEVQLKLKKQNNLSNAGIVCQLTENCFLAWGCVPPDDVTFYIVESSNENVASLKVPFNVHNHIEGYIQAFMGSCRPPLRNTVDFGFWLAPATDHVIIIGPGEENPMTYTADFRNGCKLINYRTLTVEVSKSALDNDSC